MFVSHWSLLASLSNAMFHFKFIVAFKNTFKYRNTNDEWNTSSSVFAVEFELTLKWEKFKGSD